MGAACCRALHEQLRCRKLPDSLRSELRIIRRTRKCIQSVNVLAVDPQRLAARGQDVDLRRGLHDACRQPSNRIHEMLASIKDQENSLVPSERQSGRALHRPTEPTVPASRR